MKHLSTEHRNSSLPSYPQDELTVATEADLQRLFSCEHLTFPGNLEKRNRAVIALLVVMGLRRFEVTSLTLDEYLATRALRSESQQLGGALAVSLVRPLRIPAGTAEQMPEGR